MEQHVDCRDKDCANSRDGVCACGSTDIDRLHHEVGVALPECWYWFCYTCGKEWGHS